MGRVELDQIDEGILFLLQEDARNVTTKAIGEKMDVTSSTVANRIKKLEEANIITGYHPDIDYRQTRHDHHFLVMCTVDPSSKKELVEDALDVHGVIGVRELMTDHQNVSLEVVGTSQSDIERVVEKLRKIGISVARTEILKRELIQPFDEFGRQVTSEE